jgi:hypothetical protein
MKLRSLFFAMAAALLLAAALAPRANATVIVYFNFEDGTLPHPPDQFGIVDTAADVTGPPDNNPGGGTQMSTLDLSGLAAGTFRDGTGLTLNRTAGDIDTAGSQAIVLLRAGGNQFAQICFTANTAGLTQLSLSFAVSSAGNAYTNVDLQVNGNSTTGGAGFTLNTGSTQLITFDSTNSTINSAVTGGVDTFCLVFTGGQSNGNNGQTTIDNIRLEAVPEPATVVGGLLGVIGLCWFQRRRIRLILPRCGFRGLRRA